MIKNENVLQRMARLRLEYLESQIQMNNRRKPVEEAVKEAMQLAAFPNLTTRPKTIDIENTYSNDQRDVQKEGDKLFEYISQIMSPVYARQIVDMAKKQQSDSKGDITILYYFVDNWALIKSDLLAKLGSQKSTAQVVYSHMYNFIVKRYAPGSNLGFKYPGDISQFAGQKPAEPVITIPPATLNPPILQPVYEPSPPVPPQTVSENPEGDEYVCFLLGVPPTTNLSFDDFKEACISLVNSREYKRQPLDPDTTEYIVYLCQTIVTNSNVDWTIQKSLVEGVFVEDDPYQLIDPDISDAKLKTLVAELADWALNGTGAQTKPDIIVPKSTSATEKELAGLPVDIDALVQKVKLNKSDYKKLAQRLVDAHLEVDWKAIPALKSGVFMKNSNELQKGISPEKLALLLDTMRGELVPVTGNGIKRVKGKGVPFARPPQPRQRDEPPPQPLKPHKRIVFGGGSGALGRPQDDFIDHKKLVRSANKWSIPGKPTLFLDIGLLQKGKLVVRYDTSKLYRISPTNISPGSVRVVTDIISGQPWDPRLFGTVPGPEQRLIERFVDLLGKSNQPAGYPGMQSTQNLYQEYQVSVGIIQAGNNNPKIKTRLVEILREMVALKSISAKKAHEIINGL